MWKSIRLTNEKSTGQKPATTGLVQIAFRQEEDAVSNPEAWTMNA